MKAKYILMFSFLLSLCSCSDDRLYQDPSTSLSDETLMDNSENIKAILMGAYSWTGHYHYLTIGQISLEVMGNDMKVSNGAYGFSTYNWLQFAYAYTQYPRVVDGWWSAYSPYMWRRAYLAIDACNSIISNADYLPEGCEDYLAQAYAIRGWNFLNLYHLYCPSYTAQGSGGQGLFLRTMPADATGESDVPRSDLGTSLQRIIDDFKYAYDNLTGTDRYFVTKNAAALLLARTYMDMGDYDNARIYVEELSSFDGSDLMSPSEYQEGFNTINSEWLWGFNFTSETSNIYASIPSFYQVATAKDADSTFGTEGYGTQADAGYLSANAVNYLVGYGTVRVTSAFRDMFEDGDCRKLFPFYVNLSDGYMLAKFTSKGSLGIADFPMARLAEAYLIEAECLLKGSNKNPARALEIINALREKRNASQLTSLTEDDVWFERRRELYGEGFALPDIKRLRKPLERDGQENWTTVKTLPADSPRMMYPIPQDELDYNDNATDADQNEYWR